MKQFKTKYNMETTSKQVTQEQSPIDSEIKNLSDQLSRIEKAINSALETFRRLDAPANKLNPDDFFRNNPACSEIDTSANQGEPIQPYIKSGHILKLSELVNFAKNLEQQITDISEQHIRPVANFFERNI